MNGSGSLHVISHNGTCSILDTLVLFPFRPVVGILVMTFFFVLNLRHRVVNKCSAYGVHWLFLGGDVSATKWPSLPKFPAIDKPKRFMVDQSA